MDNITRFSNSGDVYSSGISGSQDNTNGGGSPKLIDNLATDGYGSYPNVVTNSYLDCLTIPDLEQPTSSTIRVYVNVDVLEMTED